MSTAYRLILSLLLSSVALHAHAALFSLEIVEPAGEVGEIGTLHVLYHGEEENLSFAVGGLDLKLSSSTAGVIKFLDANVFNDDDRWDLALARDITDNEIGDLFTASLFSPGLAAGGPQVFAEVNYSLLGPGFTNVLLDVGGEDPLYQGDRGDVASYVRSRGICIGDCAPTPQPDEINLGDSWAILKKEFDRQRELSMAPPSQPVIPSPSAPPAPVDPPYQPPIDPIVPPISEPEPVVPPIPEVIEEPSTNDPDVTPPPVDPDFQIGYLPYLTFIDYINSEFPLTLWRSNIDILSMSNLHVVDGVDIANFSQNLTLENAAFTGALGQSLYYDLDGLTSESLTVAALSRLYMSAADGALPGTSVPEPHSLLLTVLAGISLLRCRRQGD